MADIRHHPKFRGSRPIVVGVSVYAGAILLLFGKRWVMSLVRG